MSASYLPQETAIAVSEAQRRPSPKPGGAVAFGSGYIFVSQVPSAFLTLIGTSLTPTISSLSRAALGSVP